MKTIVTGGAGFIGSHIVNRLIKSGHDVVIFDNLSSGKAENIHPEALFRDIDISDWNELSRVYKDFEGCDVIFHNAASKKNICLKDPVRDLAVNGGGTLMLLRKALKHGVKKFVHASTGSVYGNVAGRITEKTYLSPVSYYGISKLSGEKYVNYFNYAHDLNTTILRYFHVYGERQEDDPELGGVVAIFKKQIKEGRPITIHGDGRQERVFTFVEDIVEANMQAWQQSQSYGQAYNCASSHKTTVGELAEMLMRKYGEVKIKYADPLEGDIYWFDVDSSKIGQLGVKFRKLEIS